MSDQREPIWIACEGSRCPLAGGRVCAMCGAHVPSGDLDGKRVALPHQRRDILTMVERGDFG
jgi:hypothetical protein